MILLAGFATLLGRYAGQSQVVVGTPVANRTRAETERMIGFFVNMLALRIDLGGPPTFRELLRRVRETALDAYAHQDAPFDRLVDELAVARDVSRTPVFQVMLVLQNARAAQIELADLRVSSVPVDSGTAKFDMTLDVAEGPLGLAGAIEYAVDLFDASTVER